MNYNLVQLICNVFKSTTHNSEWFHNIPGVRTAVVGEILPKKIEHSATVSDDVATYALDMNLETRSNTGADSNGKVWLKMTLHKVYCLQQVIWYQKDEYPFNTWTCTKDDCSHCVGRDCSSYTLTVSTEGAVSHLPSFSNCRYGDTVEIKRIDDSTNPFSVYEMALIKKEGMLYVMSRSTIAHLKN